MLWLRNHLGNSLATAMQLIGWSTKAVLIDATSLASLSSRVGANLIFLDLRDLHEIENFSYSIPGALLTTNVALGALIRWVPRGSSVALFGSETIPLHDPNLSLPAKNLTGYALDGGLRSWCKAGLPLEPVSLSDRRWADKR